MIHHLLPESYDQIKMLGNHLKDIEFAHAFSSPIKRARITAEETLAMLNKRPELTFMDGLKEFSFGVWEGMSFGEVQEGWYDMCNHLKDEFAHAFRKPPRRNVDNA